MLSELECVLLNQWLPNPRTGHRPHICEQLFRYLDDGCSLLHLRATSCTLKDLVDRKLGRLFRNLYIIAPLDVRAEDDLDTLERLLTLCHDLTITIRSAATPNNGQSFSSERLGPALGVMNYRSQCTSARSQLRVSPSRYSNNTAQHMHLSIPPAHLPYNDQVTNELSRRQWLRIFSHCHQLQGLTFRVHGNPHWPGRTEVEDTLIVIRSALEQPRVGRLLEIRFAPVHPMGIVHLRWTGLSAFGHSSPILQPANSLPTIWSRITTLDLQILNPFTPANPLSPAQSAMFKKLLYSYLRSFTATLQLLRFVWCLPTMSVSTITTRSIGSTPGPSPITLHLDPPPATAGEGRPPLRWEALRGLWLGNIVFPHQSVQMLRQGAEDIAPKLEKLYVLRSTEADRTGQGLDDKEAWIDVSLDRRVEHVEGLREAEQDMASSFYSQSARTSGTWGVSSTSRSIPFMLDLASLQR